MGHIETKNGSGASAQSSTATVVTHGPIKVIFNDNGEVTVYTDGIVRVHPENAQYASTESKATLDPGDVMPDGTVYVGLSPDTGSPMYAAANNVPLTLKWKSAMHYAEILRVHGHADWRLPSEAELNVLFENQRKGALAGTFNKGWYWSSSELFCSTAKMQDFRDGSQGSDAKEFRTLARCVRG